MKKGKTLTVDGIDVIIENERNLLEVVRKARIEIPTFCYHSEMSIYGACRLCMVEVDGQGLVPSCSTQPLPGMVVRTNTGEIRAMRKMIVELLLANHDQECPTCSRSASCQLQKLSRRLGIHKVRFKKSELGKPLDTSSAALVRDPNKCVLCGDCVRVCAEIQSVGALDFAHRGSKVIVTPAFNKELNAVECVNCGQCAKVCPVGAIIPKANMEQAWKAIHDPQKTVIAQIAPAVRVALGEEFGFAPGTTTTGQIVASLRRMGIDKVFDTSFTADLTIIEEANEFLSRIQQPNEGNKAPTRIPQFTSCCPAWIKFAEQYYAEMLPNLSSCRSPQQMFGSLAKDVLAKDLGIAREDLVVISIMPCTAKKYEAQRPEFAVDGNPDVDIVLTTQETVLMIQESGLRFEQLEPESFDMPFGFKTGGGVIFGNSGGVAEAVLRYASEKLAGKKLDGFEFHQVRGSEGLREAEVTAGETTLRLAVVSGLGNARQLVDRIRAGEAHYDLVEVMACPGGCVNGGGQPITEHTSAVSKRTQGLYDNDRMLPLHKAQENPYIREIYDLHLEKPGSHRAHKLLHTSYQNRRRIDSEEVVIFSAPQARLHVSICFGTSCFLRGAQELYHEIVAWIGEQGLEETIELSASFCSEECKKGPVVRVGDEQLLKCTLDQVIAAIERSLVHVETT